MFDINMSLCTHSTAQCGDVSMEEQMLVNKFHSRTHWNVPSRDDNAVVVLLRAQNYKWNTAFAKIKMRRSRLMALYSVLIASYRITSMCVLRSEKWKQANKIKLKPKRTEMKQTNKQINEQNRVTSSFAMWISLNPAYVWHAFVRAYVRVQ